MSTTDPNPPNDLPTNPTPRTQGDTLAGCYALSRKLEVAEGVEVWLAHDEVLGKDVSLHFVPDAVRKDVRALQELRLDIKRNRQLIHPNILRVYDLVEEPDWVAISMDTFEGESLARHQAGKSGKFDEVQPWAEQLARTLKESHKINVLHRDLSPSNLLLTPAAKLLVANFGISRTIREARSRAGESAAAGAACESPQLREGKAAARTDDLYSFGAVVFAALAGRPPGDSADIAATLQSLDVPANWRTTIAACLEQSPEARPQSATEVVRRLTTAAAETAPAPAPTPSPVVVAPAIAAVAPVIAPPVESKPEPAPEALKLAAVVEEPKPAAVAPESKPAPVIAESKPAPEPVESKPLTQTFELKPVAPPAPAPVTEVAKPATDLVPVRKAEPVRESKRQPESPRITAPSSPVKPPDRPPLTDLTTRLYPNESRFPVTILAAAAAVIVLIAIIYHFTKPAKPVAAASSTEEPEKVELRSLPTTTAATPAPDGPVVQTNQPKEPPKASPATPSPTVKAIADRTALLEKTRAEAQAAEKAQADLVKQQQAAEASLAEIQKTIDDKTAAIKPMKKAAEEAAAQRKKLEDDKQAAETAALEAQKVAAEKAKLAEASAKALLEMEQAAAQKMTGPQQAEKEIADLQKTLAERQRAVTDGAKAVAAAEAARQQQSAAVAEHEREIERIRNSDAEVQKQKEVADAEKTRLDRELKEMQDVFKKRMEELEAKRKQLDGSAAPAPAVPPPAPAPAPQAKLTTPSPAPSTPIKMVPTSTPPPLMATPAPTVTPATAPAVAGGANSLGQKFVPVGDTEFCVWLTRVKDFEAFAKAVNLRSTSWKGPGFKQGPDHPVVNVSWQEAVAFCKWLTDKEHKDGTLAANLFYRLPTDLEWSKAVGLPDENGKTPEMRDMGVPDVYPWGTAWPPPAGAGNYTGEETGSDVAIKGYDDGFAWTAPVGSFAPNKFGLFDMGGNVWQWCMDTWNADSKAKVLRGASWYNGALKLSLLSSCRVHAAPDSSTDNYGFRIVRSKEDGKTGKK